MSRTPPSPLLAACCIFLASLATLHANASPASSVHAVVEVSGSVRVGQDGHVAPGGHATALAGVAVSNGRELVRTDAQGRYRINAMPGDTVFVVKPPGYRFMSGNGGLPVFWHRVTAGGPGLVDVDFSLRAVARDRSTPEFDVLLFADTQVKSVRDIDYYRRDVIEPLGQPRAALGVTLGDLVDDEVALYPRLDAVTTQLGVPWFHVPGNHDLDPGATADEESLRSWSAHYGPDTYAVEEGPAAFVFLDDVIVQPGQSPGYVGGLREDQFRFLENYLRQLPRERLLVLGMHIPVFDTGGRPTFRAADRERLFALLRDRPRLLLLSGHSHNQQHYRHGAGDGWHGAQPLHEYNVGAVCGAFWSGAADAQGIPDTTMSDGTPNGSALLKVRADGGYALAWRPARVPQADPAVTADMALHAPAVLRRGAYPAWGVYANVFMGEADTRVEYRVDGGGWKPMRRVERADPRLLVENVADDLAPALRGYDRSPEAVPSTHLWRGALPTDLATGEHRVEVRAFDRWWGEVAARTSYRLQDAQD